MQAPSDCSPILVENMPLNETDKAWIRQEIRQHGWGRFKNWGVVLGPAVAISIFILYQWSGYVEFRTQTGDRLKIIEDGIRDIRGQLLLSEAAQKPTSPETQKEARQIIEDATNKKLSIPTGAVAVAGQSFLSVSSTDPGAWDTAKALLDYRSSLNSGELPDTQRNLYKPLDENDRTYYAYNAVNGRIPSFKGWSKAPINEAARMELIDKPTPRGQFGNRSLLAFGQTIILDDLYLRHVVFIGVEVHYSGGPAILDDVLFIGCRFVFDNDANTRLLASSILDQTRVTATIKS